MSQEKVNRYKEEKASRKDTMKKAKKVKLIQRCALVVVVVAIVGWLGFSLVKTIEDSQPRENIVADYSAVSDYIESLTAEAEEAE